MTISDFLLRLLWVSAHHGLRTHGTHRTMPTLDQIECWQDLHQITAELGSPPAPGGPR